MAIYVLSYDLNKEKDYETLYDELKRLDGHRALNSFWLLNLENTAKEVRDHFKRYMDDDDALWVSELTNNYASKRAKKGTKDWLTANPP